MVNSTLRQRQLATRLRELRQKAGLSITEVADHLLCSPAKISRIETAQRRVSLRDVRDLSKLYGIEDPSALMALAKDAREQGWWQQGEGIDDVWLIAASSTGTSRPLLSQPFVERDARVSPDGRWVAYVSEETGRPEVSVRRMDGATRREVISAGGGDQPVWRRDGSELFFVAPDGRLMAAPMRTAAETEPLAGVPSVVPLPAVGFGHFGTQYDVSPDGQRFYLLDRRRDPAPSEIVFVTRWR